MTRFSTVVYVDTSVLVALFLNEPHSVAAADWYLREKSELVAAAWCIPEYASALGIKQRTGAIDAQQAQSAWTRFERMVAAELVLDAASALRAGDALHLACAEAAGAKRMATLDEVVARNAQRLKIKVVRLRGMP